MLGKEQGSMEYPQVDGITPSVTTDDLEEQRIKDDEIVVMFCNSHIAEEFMSTDPDLKDTLVVSDLLPDSDVIVVKKDDFLAWLYGQEDEE